MCTADASNLLFMHARLCTCTHAYTHTHIYIPLTYDKAAIFSAERNHFLPHGGFLPSLQT